MRRTISALGLLLLSMPTLAAEGGGPAARSVENEASAPAQWPSGGADPEVALPAMAPAAAASRLFGLAASVRGGVATPVSSNPYVGSGQWLEVAVGPRFLGSFVTFLAYRHKSLAPGSALLPGTTITDDSVWLKQRAYWSLDAAQRFQLFGDVSLSAGVFRFGGAKPSSASYFPTNPGYGAGVAYRLGPSWSLGLSAEMEGERGMSFIPPTAEPTFILPALTRDFARTYSIAVELHYDVGR